MQFHAIQLPDSNIQRKNPSCKYQNPQSRRDALTWTHIHGFHWTSITHLYVRADSSTSGDVTALERYFLTNSSERPGNTKYKRVSAAHCRGANLPRYPKIPCNMAASEISDFPLRAQRMLNNPEIRESQVISKIYTRITHIAIPPNSINGPLVNKTSLRNHNLSKNPRQCDINKLTRSSVFTE